MKRRHVALPVLALGLRPAAGLAQPARVWRIGFLGDGHAATRAPESVEPLLQGLGELGYQPGRNLWLEVRWTEGIAERRAALAAELVALKPDAIVTHGVPAARALKAATATVPIVVAVTADYIDSGLAASLARPGGNLTGMTDQVADLAAKEVQLLKETLPAMQRLALVWERANAPAARGADDVQAAARVLGLRVLPLPIENETDIEQAFNVAARQQADAVIVMHTPLTVGLRAAIARHALDRRLPLLGSPTQFADAGALISYGTDLTQYFRKAAVYVDRILKGARPADLPIEQPTHFELVVNLKTAKAMGVKVPQAVLVRANRVIE